MREISTTYQDPLELIWTCAANELGIKIERDSTVFATWDGAGVLRIGTPETLDPDDSLAQMILHEICHALVEEPDAFCLPDWGLDITNSEHRVHEHACLRLQASLADRYGLRRFFAATTNARSYYDAMPDNPLEAVDDPAVRLALPGWERARSGSWSQSIDRALQKTAQIAEILQELAPPDSLWSRT